MITSPDNPQLKALAKLTTRKYRRRENRFLVDDPIILREAMAAGAEPDMVFLSREMDLPGHLPVTEVAEPLLARISDQPSFSGMIARFEIPRFDPEKPVQRTLILENVQDPSNLGAILRSAVLFGVDTVWTTPDCADCWSLKTVRSAKGAMFHLNIDRTELETILAETQDRGLPLVGADTRGGRDPGSLSALPSFALAVGNEGQGLSDTLRKHCAHLVTIPTTGKLESLNVAAAAAIMLNALYHP